MLNDFFKRLFSGPNSVPKQFLVTEIALCLVSLGLLIYSMVGTDPSANVLNAAILTFLCVLVVDTIGRTVVLNCADSAVYDPTYKDGPHYAYHDFKNGFAVVEEIIFESPDHMSGSIQFNFINKEGNVISQKWFDGVSEFYDEGVAIVMVSDSDGTPRYNIVDGEGKILSVNWMYDIHPFANGVARVFWAPDNTVNFLRADGTLLWDTWKPSYQGLCYKDIARAQIEQAQEDAEE